MVQVEQAFAYFPTQQAARQKHQACENLARLLNIRSVVLQQSVFIVLLQSADKCSMGNLVSDGETERMLKFAPCAIAY